jgi:hypothetical protein
MAKWHGKNIYAAICQAVGLNPKMWHTLDIHLAIDDVARVRAEGYAEFSTPEELTSIFQEFELVYKGTGERVGPVTNFIKEDE